MIPVAGYCRVSTDHADQANSFSAQKRYFSSYILNHPDWILYQIYADEGITGTSTRHREQFNHMIQDARDGKFQLILSKEVSRFSRNLLDTIVFTRELARLGVGVIFLTDGIDTREPDAELRLSIMASIAQEESRKTSLRVRWGQLRQMERGVVFGRSLLGYQVKAGVLSVEPIGAAIVKQIFEKYTLEKKSASVIARELEKSGIAASTGKTSWKPSHIIKILKNETYVGDLIQGKTWTPDYLTHQKKYNHDPEKQIYLPNHHEAIIDRTLWLATQLELSRRSRRSSAASGPSVSYPLSGRIFCGSCGSSCVLRSKKNRNGTMVKKWRCATACSQGAIRYEKNGILQGCDIGYMLRDEDGKRLIQIALERADLCREDVILTTARAAVHAILQEQFKAGERRTKLLSQKAVLQNRRAIALNAYLQGEITREELDLLQADCLEEMSAIDQELSASADQFSGTQQELTDVLQQQLNSILREDALPDPVCRIMVDRITLQKEGNISVSLAGARYEVNFQIKRAR